MQLHVEENISIVSSCKIQDSKSIQAQRIDNTAFGESVVNSEFFTTAL
jgi:hypothetical protein